MCRWKWYELLTYYCLGHISHCMSTVAAQSKKCTDVIFSLCSNVTTWLLTDNMMKIDLASCFARGSVASTCSVGLWNVWHYAPIVRQCIRVFSSMAWGIKAILCAYGLTVLTNPEPCSADLLSVCLALLHIHMNWAPPRRVYIYTCMPSYNDMNYIRKMIIWKVFCCI